MRSFGTFARKATSVMLSATMLVTGLQYQPPPAIAQPAPPTKAEAVSKRTTNSRTFELSDGTYETEVYDEPVFFASETTTTLLPIDSSLEETYTVRGRSFRNRANAFSLELPDKLDDGWASVESTMGRVAFRPATRATLPEAALTFDTPAERSLMSKAQVEYKGAFAGATIEYLSSATGLKETIVLERFTGRNVYSFDLIAEDVTPQLNASGGIDFLSEESTRPVFQIEAPYMFDASAGADGSSAVSRDVHYELYPALMGWRIDVVADREWLADPARVWPVRIDPTVKYAWINQYFSDFAYVSSQYPSTNFYAAWEDGTFPLKVGKMAGYYYRSYVQSSYLENDLQWMRDLDADIQILYARLALWCYTTTPSPTTVFYDKVTSAWSGTSLTWNNQPSYAYAGQFSQAANTTSGGLYVTQMVKDWLAAPGSNHGLMLWGDTAFTKYVGWDAIGGIAGDHHPTFKIAWTTVPKVEPVSPAPDTIVDGQPTIIWNYDDDKHRLADLNGSLISKPQQKVEIQFSSKPDTSGLLDTVPVDNLKDYDHTVTPAEFGFTQHTRYFWRMRAAGLSDYPNVGDTTWSNWTDWTGFVTGHAQDSSDGRGIEAARASEPLGAGASVEVSSGALIIARQDLSGPARAGGLSYGMSYRSDQAGSPELPTGWRSPVSTIVRNDNRAPDPGFEALTLTGWTTWRDPAVSVATTTSAPLGRFGKCLAFSSTSPDQRAYVKSHADGTGAYPVWPGQRIEAGAWMFASDLLVEADTDSPTAFGGVVKIHFWKADGTYVGEARSGNYAEYRSGYWRRVGVAATVPADAYFARVNIEYQNTKGTLYVDDAYFGDGSVNLTDADGTKHTLQQVKDGAFTRDPLAQGAGLQIENLAAGAPVSANVATVNDAPDPGFEQTWASGGWYTNSTTLAKQQTSVKRTGTGALKFYSATNTSVYVSPSTGTTATMFPIGGVRHLHSSMWVNTDGLSVDTSKTEYGVFFKYHFYTSNGTFISTVQPASGTYWNVADTNGWREVVLEGDAPANAAFVKFNIEYRYASGTAYVDDVEMGYGAKGTQ
ncbi:MAG: DNRLRE domain-containing protein [Coriobacteriia bacterium]|nr:DNRLRE domain-containing protein [Coriobacteriia bacterium]